MSDLLQEASELLEATGRRLQETRLQLIERGHDAAEVRAALRAAVSTRTAAEQTIAARLLGFASEEWQGHEQLLARVETADSLPLALHEKREALYQLVADGKLETQRDAAGQIEYRLPPPSNVTSD